MKNEKINETLNEVKRLEDEAKKAIEAAKAAKAAVKAAKEAAKGFGSRPIRTSYFIALYSTDESVIIKKGDVHYVVEKAAIDEVIRQRDENEEYRSISLYKIRKDDNERENRILVSQIYIDSETNQVVID